MSSKFPRGLEQDLSQLAVHILCDDFTMYYLEVVVEEEEEEFASETDTIDMVYVDDMDAV